MNWELVFIGLFGMVLGFDLGRKWEKDKKNYEAGEKNGRGND